jgi:hypothetical protein
VAALAGKFEPKQVFPGHLELLSIFYNRAPVEVERNNHGHAVIAGLEARGVRVLRGFDQRPGWHTTPAGKVRLYDGGASIFQQGETLVHSFRIFLQLGSIDINTLSAPEGEMDDLATAYMLALAGQGQGRDVGIAFS